jgi:hypothetical protein
MLIINYFVINASSVTFAGMFEKLFNVPINNQLLKSEVQISRLK